LFGFCTFVVLGGFPSCALKRFCFPKTPPHPSSYYRPRDGQHLIPTAFSMPRPSSVRIFGSTLKAISSFVPFLVLRNPQGGLGPPLDRSLKLPLSPPQPPANPFTPTPALSQRTSQISLPLDYSVLSRPHFLHSLCAFRSIATA